MPKFTVASLCLQFSFQKAKTVIVKRRQTTIAASKTLAGNKEVCLAARRKSFCPISETISTVPTAYTSQM